MEINIKMQTTLNGEKGCYTKEELEKYLREIVEMYDRNQQSTIDNEIFKNMIVDKISTEFANRLPRNFDYNFNRLVAGLMGSTCYMPDSFKTLNERPNSKLLNIASLVENNGHHSTFGHSYLTLEITNIPKALAMVLNNEHDYNTSEKSARFTVMTEIDPKQRELYDKWLLIFERKIKERYPNGCNNFFDIKGKKAHKLAQENARYMISVFTPTNMVYTTNFRQLNYICHWMEKQIDKPSNNFYRELKESMREFVTFCKTNNLYSEKLSDGKNRDFSLFGDPILKQDFSSNYQCTYKMSFAALAQAQRHRTLDFNINKLTFVNDFEKNRDFYIPPIIKDEPNLVKEYLNDLASIAETLPQATLVDVVERGTYENFIQKTKERNCVLAQKEIRDLTVNQAQEYLKQLIKEREHCWDRSLLPIYDKRIAELEKIVKGSRCTSGYNCQSPCQFPDGILHKSDI